MRSAYGNPEAVAREIGTQLRGTPAKLRARKFGRVAKILWPVKTAATIADIANRANPLQRVSDRTAERWLSGEFEPPGVVLGAAIIEMIKVE